MFVREKNKYVNVSGEVLVHKIGDRVYTEVKHYTTWGHQLSNYTYIENEIIKEHLEKLAYRKYINEGGWL